MRAIQHVHQNKIKEARLEIVAQMYKRGSTIRAIRAEVMRRLDLKTYSTQTVHKDVQTLLKEWRESRLGNMDDALQLELARIDDTVRELWEQWEKSKEDYTKTQRRRKGAPKTKDDVSGGDDGGIRTFSVEEQTEQVVRLGNPTYIAEIRQQLAERRKLLGLYAPEKRDIKGEVSVSRPPSEMTVEEIEKELETLKLTE
ncbi:MAG: hypothetical protein ACFNP8_00915 [Alloprevotella sp.]